MQTNLWETRRYRLLPLTPLHVGSGETLAPEEYLLDGSDLVRFRPAAALQAMSETDRRRYVAALDANRLSEALQVLRGAARGAELYRVRLGEGARSDLLVAVENPGQRRGEVAALQRNPTTGDVVVPGSAIKGAMRTAVLNAMLQAAPEVKREFETREDRWAAEELPQRLLEYDGKRLERDPFRLLRVTDVTFPRDVARVDKLDLRSRSTERAPGQKPDGRQVHYERLACAEDGGRPPMPRVEVALWKGRATQGMLRLDWDGMVSACNGFFQNRLQEEIDRWEELYQPFDQLRHLAGATLSGQVLLRLGRFSQFESLSVDGLRHNWHIKLKQRITRGTSRMTCELAAHAKRGIRQAPFGWALLMPEA